MKKWGENKKCAKEKINQENVFWSMDSMKNPLRLEIINLKWDW